MIYIEEKISDITNGVISNSEKAIGRELDSWEKSLVEFAVTQVKYGFWK
jgi:hypothetical protein